MAWLAQTKPNGTAAMHYEHAVELAQHGHYAQAATELRQAIRLKPDFAEAYLELGNACLAMQRPSDAIKAYSEAQRIRPECSEAYQGLGITYDRSGRFFEAMKMFMKAIRLKPDDVGLRNDLGLAYFNIGGYRESIKAYQQALELDPQNGRAHYSLGLVYLDLKDAKLAWQEQQTLEELGHNDLASQLLEKIQKEFTKDCQQACP